MPDNRTNSIPRALAAGMIVLESDGSALQIDCDTAEQFDHCRMMLEMFAPQLGFPAATVTRSRRSRWHVHVPLKSPLPIPIRHCLASVFGQ